MKSASPNAGTAAMEFGLAAPFLLVLLLGIVELGFGAYQAMRVTDAAEAGALYAAKYGFDTAGIQAAVIGAAGTGSKVTASPAPVEFCGCPSASGIAAISCSVKCASGDTPGVYIQVNAAIPHATILPFAMASLPSTLTAQSTVRVN